MTIDKEEIHKYIFDPDNPKQCKSYKLLLTIAKKDNASWFSPELQRIYSEAVSFSRYYQGQGYKPKRKISLHRFSNFYNCQAL